VRALAKRPTCCDRQVREDDFRVNSAQSAVTSSLVGLHVADVLRLDPDPLKFDKIFAVRVGLFHRQPNLIDTLLKKRCTPRGNVLVVYDEP
jgi:hypothetical protein